MNNWVWRIFLLVLILVPLPLGGFRPWAWSAVGLAIAVLLLTWCVSAATGRMGLFWRLSLWPPAVLFAAVVAWILVQALWPAPATVAHPLWQMAQGLLGTPLQPRISASPEDGLAALLRLLSGAGCFWLALQYGNDRDRAWELVTWLAWAGAAYGIYGLLNFLAGNDWLLIYRRWTYHNDITGSFVNRNTYATYAGLGLLALTTLLIRAFRHRWRIGDAGLSWLGRRVEAFGGRAAVLLGLTLVTAMALLQSHSRMGMLASATGIAVLLLLLRVRGILKGWLTPVFVAAAALFVFLASGTTTFDRIAGADLSDRTALYAATQQAIESAPLLGSGYGSFASVFQMYRDLTLPSAAEYLMAHNTYLELAFGLGIPAAAALLLAVLWLAIACLVGMFRRSRDEELPILAFSAVVLVGVHALLDFSMQIPGVGYTLLAMLGVGVAQAYPTIQPRYERPAD